VEGVGYSYHLKCQSNQSVSRPVPNDSRVTRLHHHVAVFNQQGVRPTLRDERLARHACCFGGHGRAARNRRWRGHERGAGGHGNGRRHWCGGEPRHGCFKRLRSGWQGAAPKPTLVVSTFSVAMRSPSAASATAFGFRYSPGVLGGFAPLDAMSPCTWMYWPGGSNRAVAAYCRLRCTARAANLARTTAPNCQRTQFAMTELCRSCSADCRRH